MRPLDRRRVSHEVVIDHYLCRIPKRTVTEIVQSKISVEEKMEILVCVKRVPDTSENEIEVRSDGTDIERDDLVYSVNEWDNYAVEEAIQIRDNVGGNITVVTVGDEESEEVLRREMAMGADQGILLSDEAFENSDGKGTAIE